MVYTALAGHADGCVRFFGFTTVLVDSSQNILSGSADGTESSFALVFDFANQGTVQDYLEWALTPGSTKENWVTILSMLGDICFGLETIHSRGVLHR